MASGMANTGFGLETPARHFKLDFRPLAAEHYILLCTASTLAGEPVQALPGRAWAAPGWPRWTRCRGTTPAMPAVQPLEVAFEA